MDDPAPEVRNSAFQSIPKPPDYYLRGRSMAKRPPPLALDPNKKIKPGRWVCIDGVEYASIVRASAALQLSVSTVKTRLDSPNFPTWAYVGFQYDSREYRRKNYCP